MSINRRSDDKYNIIMSNEEILRDIGFNEQTIDYIVTRYLSDELSDHQTLEYWIKDYIEYYFRYRDDWRNDNG